MSISPPNIKTATGLVQGNINRDAVYKIADNICSKVRHHAEKYSVRVCKTRADLESAYKLVYKEYLTRGYCVPNPVEMHYSFYCVLPHTRTFILEKDGAVVGTLSSIADSPVGLPLEKVFSEDVARLRSNNRRLGELGLLSLDSDEFSRDGLLLTDETRLSAFLLLSSAAYRYLSIHASDILIAVNPKHRMLYEYLKFVPSDQVSSYAGGNGAAALALRLDVEETLHTTALNKVHHPEQHLLEEAFRWTREHIREFLVHKRPIWSHIPGNIKQELRQCLDVGQMTLTDIACVSSTNIAKVTATNIARVTTTNLIAGTK